MDEKIHLKGLNGLRAIAALGVVWSHTGSSDFPFLYTLHLGLAQYSVTLFFALSGFLITYLLFVEKERTGISIKSFYIRRILRIWPIYFLYLLAAVISISIYHPGVLPGSLPYYLFLAANIPPVMLTSLPYLGHYWSLGVEEQFYLFWPWIIKKSTHVLKALIIFTAAFFALKLFFRFVYFQWGNITPLYVTSTFRFDCMAMGGMAALLCLQGHRLFLKIVTHRITEIICWLSLGLMAADWFYITPMLNHELAAVVGIGLIVNQSFNKKPLINLENHFFDFMGRLSYGIYVIHPLVIFYYSRLINGIDLDPLLRSILAYGGAIILSTGVAWISYEFYEKRFLRLKVRFSQVNSSDSM